MSGAQPGRIDGARAWQHRFLDAHVDRVRFPDGSEGEQVLIHHPGASAIVPVLSNPRGDDPQVLLIHQYRYATAERRGVELDEALVRRKLRETAQVSALLQSVFAEEEPAPEPRESPEAPATPTSQDEPACAGLDPRHSAFLRALCARPSWPRAELEELALPLGLMLDGALDQLNEVAFERCDAPLWEGDDPIEIDSPTAEELIR
jgi:hypothetical protein